MITVELISISVTSQSSYLCVWKQLNRSPLADFKKTTRTISWFFFLTYSSINRHLPVFSLFQMTAHDKETHISLRGSDLSHWHLS